jgi:hypothetical protein
MYVQDTELHLESMRVGSAESLTVQSSSAHSSIKGNLQSSAAIGVFWLFHFMPPSGHFNMLCAARAVETVVVSKV